MEKIWLKRYPQGVPANIDVDQYPSLVALLEDSLKHASLPAYKFMGKAISFALARPELRARSPVPAVARPAGATAWPSCCPTSRSTRWRWRRCCAPATWWSTSTALHAARTRAPAEGLRRQGHPHRRELRPRAAAGDERGADQEGSSPRWATCWASQVADRQLRGAQGEDMVPAYELPSAPCASTTRSRRGAGRVLHRPRRWERRHRRAAVHRRLPASARAQCCCIVAWSPTSCSRRPGALPKGEQIVTVCALP